MSKQWIVIAVLALAIVLPVGASAEYLMPVSFEGRIGDFAPKSRIYEIEGQMFQLAPETLIVNTEGKPLTLTALQGGVRVRVHGRKVIGTYRQQPLKITKIVVLGRSD